MSSSLRITIPHLASRTFAHSTRTSFCIIQAQNASTTKDWQGRQPSEHVTNQKDDLNIHASASQSGQGDRMKDAHSSSDSGQSQATTEKDKGGQNAQAKRDHPEAPGPVIGMNDERGGVSVVHGP